MRRPPTPALWIGAAIVALAVVLLYRQFDLGQLLTLDNLKASRDALQRRYAAGPGSMIAGYFAVYVVATALSIPGAAVLTLAAGAVFGFWAGLVVVSFASSLGALLAFLVSRHLLRDAVQARFGARLAAVNEGVERDGTFYLLTLRLVPVFPFWLVNLLMGLTPISAGRYYLVSQVGMLAGTAVYVNAGTHLAAIGSAGDVLSPGLVASLTLLGVFPLLAKAAVGALQRRRRCAKWRRPKRFDRNLVVVGAGAGGLVAAYVAAALKAKVTLVEGHRMGGDCLNTGCVPSKALIRSAKAARQIRDARRFGIADAHGRVDFAAVMRRVHDAVRAIEPHDSVERYTQLGVEVLHGHARITDPWTIEVAAPDGTPRTLTARSIVIAAGAAPIVPPIPGLADAGCLTSDTVWRLTELPRRLVVLGGGPVGCELAQAFARLGSRVTLVEMAPRLLPREDAEASGIVAEALRADGVDVLAGHRVVRVETVDGGKRLVAAGGLGEVAIDCDELLCAVGRRARVAGYGIEELGIALTPAGTIETNAYLQTSYPNIYAVGDVAGPLQFTHAAAHQGSVAAVNALLGRFRRLRADTAPMPRATFTDPEVARVGLTESEAEAQGTAVEVTRFALAGLDRAIVDGCTEGFVKVLTAPGKDRILGATIVGEHAGDLLAEFVLAMRCGVGLNRILGTVHAYPTLAEANRSVAGEWRRAHAPQRLLRWLARWHAWERA